MEIIKANSGARYKMNLKRISCLIFHGDGIQEQDVVTIKIKPKVSKEDNPQKKSKKEIQ